MRSIFILFCVIIAGCSTMKPQECYNANWRDIGYNDAIQGRTVWLKSRTQACAKVNLKPNRSAYIAGHQAGSKEFCTYKNGYTYGRRAEVRTPICLSPDVAKPFNDGYKDGLEAYEDARDFHENLFGTFGQFHD